MIDLFFIHPSCHIMHLTLTRREFEDIKKLSNETISTFISRLETKIAKMIEGKEQEQIFMVLRNI